MKSNRLFISLSLIGCVALANLPATSKANSCRHIFLEQLQNKTSFGGRPLSIVLDNMTVDGVRETPIPFLRPSADAERLPARRMLTVIPYDGIGKATLYSFPAGATHPGGHFDRSAIRAFARYQPELAAQFGIGINQTHLLIPNADRLNHFFQPILKARAEKYGVEVPNLVFKDISIFLPQVYSQKYFFEMKEQGFLPLASRGRYEKHDRVEEHLIGALFVPIATLQVIDSYVKFISEVKKLDLVRSNWKLRNALNDETNAVSDVWDSLTTVLGYVVGEIVRPGNYIAKAMYQARREVVTTHYRLGLENVPLKKLMDAIDANSSFTPYQKNGLKMQILQLRIIHMQKPLSRDEIDDIVDQELKILSQPSEPEKSGYRHSGIRSI